VKNLNSGWTIEEQCPQCGAPITLQETDRIFSCDFCRVKLYILSSGFFRYYIPPPKDLKEEIVYAPYWRFRGMSFIFSQTGLKHRIIDANRLATGHQLLPASLGLRPQTQKIQFLSSEVTGKFLKQKIPFKQILTDIENPGETSPGQNKLPSVLHQGFIGETTSLIYAPFYLKDYKFYDALLEKAVKTKPGIRTPKSVPLETDINWNRSFLSTLCPLCGWDLGSEKESCILMCSNCCTAWKASLSGFKKVMFKIIEVKAENILYVPFWKIQTAVDKLPLQSYADLARLANLPRIASRAWEKEKLYFWAPAFKVAPKLFLRLSKQLTLSNFTAKAETGSAKTGLSFFPVTLPATEAVESIRVTLFHLFINKKKFYSILPEVHAVAKKQELIYLPFTIRANEIVQVQMKFSISKNALKIGRAL